ncbi:MAG: hypothetical protein HY665_01465 [Chloroflexi bacterium]|nr:hypothetical protein [Chloroflexota bacterium]
MATESTHNDRESGIEKRLELKLVVALFVLAALGIPPIVNDVFSRKAVLYYGWLVFILLLSTSMYALHRTASIRLVDINHRMVHFTLRIAWTLAIGSVISSAIFLAGIMRLMPVS